MLSGVRDIVPLSSTLVCHVSLIVYDRSKNNYSPDNQWICQSDNRLRPLFPLPATSQRVRVTFQHLWHPPFISLTPPLPQNSLNPRQGHHLGCLSNSQSELHSRDDRVETCCILESAARSWSTRKQALHLLVLPFCTHTSPTTHSHTLR